MRLSDGGRFATDSPGRHSVAGRMGRGVKPPPQFGQTLSSLCSTQSAQNVHSNVQIMASVADGGRSLSQYSQFGRSSSAIAVYLLVRDRSEAFSCGSGRTSKRGLNIQRFRLRELGALLDEAETRLWLGAHQRIDC
jgi:hypothetical protein